MKLSFRILAKQLKVKEQVLKKVLVSNGLINSHRKINPAAMEAGKVEVRYVSKGYLQVPTPFYDLEYVKELLAGTGYKFERVPETSTGYVELSDVV